MGFFCCKQLIVPLVSFICMQLPLFDSCYWNMIKTILMLQKLIMKIYTENKMVIYRVS
jgi:hypothetical protein